MQGIGQHNHIGPVGHNGSNVIALALALYNGKANVITLYPLGTTGPMLLHLLWPFVTHRRTQSHWTRWAQRVQCDCTCFGLMQGIGQHNHIGPVGHNGSNVIALALALYNGKDNVITLYPLGTTCPMLLHLLWPSVRHRTGQSHWTRWAQRVRSEE